MRLAVRLDAWPTGLEDEIEYETAGAVGTQSMQVSYTHTVSRAQLALTLHLAQRLTVVQGLSSQMLGHIK